MYESWALIGIGFLICIAGLKYLNSSMELQKTWIEKKLGNLESKSKFFEENPVKFYPGMIVTAFGLILLIVGVVMGK